MLIGKTLSDAPIPPLNSSLILRLAPQNHISERLPHDGIIDVLSPTSLLALASLMHADHITIVPSPMAPLAQRCYFLAHRSTANIASAPLLRGNLLLLMICRLSSTRFAVSHPPRFQRCRLHPSLPLNGGAAARSRRPSWFPVLN
jgi:hypothetical protein